MPGITVQLKANGYYTPVQLWKEDGEIWFQFNYNLALQAEIKTMQGAKWHGYDKPTPKKNWTVADCRRNHFQLAYLMGKNPYAQYEKTPHLEALPTERFNLARNKSFPLLRHQPAMTAHMLYHGCIVAGEMGTSKTLSEIIAQEIIATKFRFKYGCSPEVWYVAPRAAVAAVKHEYHAWGAAFKPEFMTYEEMVKRAKTWISGRKSPFRITFDECSKLKNFLSQRSQAAFQFAEGIRNDWTEKDGGLQGYVNLMSGSPAPKSPLDWWSQAEIACPGFLKEGDIYKFKNRLAVIIQKESIKSGGVYPELVTWRDSELKCNVCGRLEADPIHSGIGELVGATSDFKAHSFQESVNEVATLYKRLAGLVIVFFKKDCLDLPEKSYRLIKIKPTPAILRASRLIAKTAKTVIEGLTRLRELSDGFQYEEIPDGTETCPACQDGTVFEYTESTEEGPPQEGKKIPCPHCKGTQQVTKYRRIVNSISSPKDDVLQDLMDEYEDVGRMVVFGGFTGTIDRIVSLYLKQKWAVIRLDQGKTTIYDSSGQIITDEDFINMFQYKLTEYPRVAFVAHPGSGGMGLTLTASPVAVYYSNDFNGESRIQSEDRIHRTGMDVNKGATIIDLVHLPSDQKVLDNLKAKRDLQAMTLGDFVEQGTTVFEEGVL